MRPRRQAEGLLDLASVRHFVLVSQQEVRVELYTRQGDGSFRFEVLGPGATARLEDLASTFLVDELYAGVRNLPGD